MAAALAVVTTAGCSQMLGRDTRPVAVGFYPESAGAAERAALRDALIARHVSVLAALGAPGRVAEWSHVTPDSLLESERIAHDLPGVGSSLDYGPLHLTIVETRERLAPETEAYQTLLEDLSSTRRPWKVVILPAPIFASGPVPVDMDRLPLADLLARQRVRLAITPAGAGCFRSLRIGPHEEMSVHYVLLGAPGEPPASVPAWTARATAAPCGAVLEVSAQRFRWSLYDGNGKLVDLLSLRPDERIAARYFSIGEVLAGLEPADPADRSDAPNGGP